ncbi:ER membrane protein complex subunit 8 [Strongylocentrotus purpuratus]|uniref:MPN domain-containing protein n=1 Tax=Strongylocentrotus purpuratus TaxID=7668 RepID=A0A7M7N6P8_STRPU|nr:ER membrane protein complex subunit 8 [Strongylocentrotus purpuratus]
MAEYKVKLQAYAKAILHAAKYPHCAVNGVLLADKEKLKDGRCLEFVDCVPFFHHSLALAPMLEVALVQVDAYCQAQGLKIAAYYQANELLKDLEPDSIAVRIADRINDNSSDSCLLMIDNTKLTAGCEKCVLRLHTLQDGKWGYRGAQASSLKLDNSDTTLRVTADLLRSRAYNELVDFDTHLGDITKEWQNLELNTQIENCS